MKKILALLFALLASPAAAQTIPSGTWGSINYWGVGGLSQVLSPGLAGQCLQTQGVGSAPVWATCFALPPQNANTILANVTTNFVAPQTVDINRVLDTVGYDIARPPAPESIIYKSNVGPLFNWQALPPSTAGSLLTSGGPTNPPFWSPSPTQSNLASICQTVGAVLYFDTPSLLWKCLAPGSSGQLLQTGGAGVNPSWLTLSAAAPLNYANGSITMNPIGANTVLGSVAGGTPGALSQGQLASMLSLGTMANQNASSVAITGGTITGLPTPANPSDAAIKSYVDVAASAPPANLAPNSSLGVCSSLPLQRVGSPIAASGWAQAGTGNIQLTTTGTGGLAPGKLIFVENSGTGSFSALSVTTAAGTVGVQTTRITAANGTFNAQPPGGLVQVTSSSIGAPTTFYSIRAVDVTNHAWIEVFGGAAGDIIPHTTGTMTFNVYAGPSTINQSVNGIYVGTSGNAGATNPYIAFFAEQGAPLQVVQTGTNAVWASMAGQNLTTAGSASATVWEVTPGDDGWGAGDACDGWQKTGTLKYWRQYKTNEVGTTVTLPGAAYAGKMVKGASSAENFWTNLAANNPISRTISNPAKLAAYAGRTLTCGFQERSPAASTARPFLYDGITFTFGNFFVSGAYDYEEVSATMSPSATTIQCGVQLTGNIGDTHYVTEPRISFGSKIGANNYGPSTGFFIPNIQQGFFRYQGGTNAVLTTGASIRVQQESFGIIPIGMAGVSAYLEGASIDNPYGGQARLTLESDLASNSPGSPIYQAPDEHQLMFSSGTAGIPDATTTFLGQGYNGGEPAAIWRCLSGFRVIAVEGHQAAASTGTTTYTVRKNSVSQSLTCSHSGAAADCIDSTVAHAFTCGPAGNSGTGDFISIQAVTAGGANTSQHTATILLIGDPNQNNVISQAASDFTAFGQFTEPNGSFVTDILYLNGLNFGAGFSGWINLNIATKGYWQ